MLSPRNLVAASIVAAGLTFLCLAGPLPRAKDAQAEPRKPPQSPGKNNLLVEASNRKLARLTLEVRTPESKEPLKYEIKAAAGNATGGIFLPPGAAGEIVASAFDDAGSETHRGTQSLSIEGKAIVPRSIRLEPKEAGEPLIVRLSSYRIELAAKKTRNGTFRVRVNVFDPDGRPATFLLTI